ncbi:DUF6802 family protein [Nakamurella sp. A5-74]|uniref:DUF6802 family protein n=1 Tax=Nakamurella sp. A5-74 TaxID=3158264 RepID=A0AAU8DPV1_9ACTN
MEYSDGPDQVEPGDELVMDHESLGAASYDSDHDGVADSVIIGIDDHTVMFTDTDGDGEVDSRTTFGADGEVLEEKNVSGEDATTSSSDSTDSSGNTGSDTTGGDTTGGDTTGRDTTGSDTTGDDSSETSSTVISVVDDQGRSVDVGPPTVDMDGDGTADTAVVQGDGGSTIGYTDRNGDGEADQITEITADRHVTISVVNSSGDWEVAQTGTLDPDGHFVPSEGTGTTTDDLRQDGPAAESVAWGLLPAGTADASEAADPAVGQSEASESTAPDDTAGSVPIVYTDPEGITYELGVPTEDFDGDGRADTVITTLADGTVVGYSDVDGDGLTDQVTQINTDGTVTIGVPDGVGGWEEAATGTLGENGEFVPA